jgi:hypothetical protein
MDGISAEVYKEVDPSKKDAVWANNVISIYRRDWRSFVNRERSIVNNALLDSRQSMEKIEQSFKDKSFKKLIDRFDPLGIMEAYKNALIEELTKNPPKAELKATDPSAISERKSDIELLKNRKIIEGDISKAQQQIKLPAYKMDYNKFKGNVEQFDKSGLNDNDPEDITYYEENEQRLNYEIAGQLVSNNIMKLNRFDEDKIRNLARNVLGLKAIVLQTYVDKITGEIKYQYIYPETAYGIFGDSNDGHDNICQGWQDNKTVMEWLQMVGDDFDFERDWRQLLWAINYTNPANKYTGFIRNNVTFDCCGNETWMRDGGMEGLKSNLCDWTLAFSYKICMGYIEWNSLEVTATYLFKKDNPGYVVDMVPYSYDLKKKKQIKEYEKESWYQQQWYGSYFLATTSITQWIYGFSKVYYQTLHGANDEYSSGSMVFYQEQGLSAVEIAMPYIKMANFAFYRMLWCVTKAKPDADQVILEEMIKVSKGLQRLYPQTSTNKVADPIDNILKKYIQFREEHFIELRSYPQIEGKTIAQLPSLEKKHNGLDPVAIAMQAVVSWAESQISQKIGINPMRIGMNPPSRESNKSEMQSIEYSINSTGYVYRMLQYLKERVATITLNYAQDIVKFKDAIPYKWLKKLLGNESFDAISLLDNFSAHRYGMFIRDYNTGLDKQRIIQAADMALQQKTIDIIQWSLITQTEDYKKGIKLIGLFQRKKDKKDRLQKLQDMKIEQETQQQKYEQEKDLINTKGQWDLKKAQEEKEGFIQAAKINSEGRIQVKEIGVSHEGEKQAAKSEGNKDLAEKKQNLKEQEPFTSKI